MATQSTRLSWKPKMITCSCCGKTKPETEFYMQSYTNRRMLQCKECCAIKRHVMSKRNKLRHSKFLSKERRRGFEEPTLSLQDWKECMLHFRGQCAFCGKSELDGTRGCLDRDHLVAISKGGRTVRNNIVPACTTCNRGRGNKDWRTWFREQSFWSQEREDAIAEWERGDA